MSYTLAFDVYGTLINTAGVFHSLERLIGNRAQAFMDTWRNKQLEYSFRRAAMNLYVDFSVCTQEALTYSCLAFKLAWSTEQKTTLMREYKVLPAFPDVEKNLASLKAIGHSIYAFSNGSFQAIEGLLNHANISRYFDGMVSVERVSMFKPSPIVYQHFNTTTKTKKENTWLISGNPFDVMGAANYGMNTVWIKRSPKVIFDPWGIKPTETITSLDELTMRLTNYQ